MIPAYKTGEAEIRIELYRRRKTTRRHNVTNMRTLNCIQRDKCVTQSPSDAAEVVLPRRLYQITAELCTAQISETRTCVYR